MSQLSTIQGIRSLIILQNLQNQIEQHLPTIKDFFKYRDEILKSEGWDETQILIKTEESLRVKKDYLENRINETKEGEKKKEFVDTRAKLHTTTNKLKDVSKQLNRILCETRAVTENELKLQHVFSWINEKLERDSIESFLLSQNSIISSGTAIEKNQRMTKVYGSLQNEMAEMKKRASNITIKEAGLQTLRTKIEQVEGDLKAYMQGTNTALLSHRVEMNQMKESKVREFQQLELQFREEIERIKKVIENERVKQMNIVSYYSKQMSMTQNELDECQRKWEHRSKEAQRDFSEASEKRDSNLKVLLELRLQWQQSENKRELEIQEKLQLKAQHDEKERQHDAAIILQNKVKVMYLSKLKKQVTKSKGKKKKASKGKKKKK